MSEPKTASANLQKMRANLAESVLIFEVSAFKSPHAECDGRSDFAGGMWGKCPISAAQINVREKG